jgi:hypothetical protein
VLGGWTDTCAGWVVIGQIKIEIKIEIKIKIKMIVFHYLIICRLTFVHAAIRIQITVARRVQELEWLVEIILFFSFNKYQVPHPVLYNVLHPQYARVVLLLPYNRRAYVQKPLVQIRHSHSQWQAIRVL